jgi:hypothetical protein
MKSGEHSYENSGYERSVFPGYWLPPTLPKSPTDREADNLHDEKESVKPDGGLQLHIGAILVQNKA